MEFITPVLNLAIILYLHQTLKGCIFHIVCAFVLSVIQNTISESSLLPISTDLSINVTTNTLNVSVETSDSTSEKNTSYLPRPVTSEKSTSYQPVTSEKSTSYQPVTSEKSTSYQPVTTEDSHLREIIGGVCGGGVVVIAFIMMFYCYRRRFRRKRKKKIKKLQYFTETVVNPSFDDKKVDDLSEIPHHSSNLVRKTSSLVKRIQLQNEMLKQNKTLTVYTEESEVQVYTISKNSLGSDTPMHTQVNKTVGMNTETVVRI